LEDTTTETEKTIDNLIKENQAKMELTLDNVQTGLLATLNNMGYQLTRRA
jgi:hypothetical protein